MAVMTSCAYAPYYNYQLSKVRWKFGHRVLTWTSCCCYRQLAPFAAATCHPLTSLTAKCKACKIVCDTGLGWPVTIPIVTNRNKVSCPLQHRNFNFVTKLPMCLSQLKTVGDGPFLWVTYVYVCMWCLRRGVTQLNTCTIECVGRNCTVPW